MFVFRLFPLRVNVIMVFTRGWHVKEVELSDIALTC